MTDFNVINNEFDNLTPWGNMARCVMDWDGKVLYFLDPNDSNKKADGTLVDWEEVENNAQNVMVQVPKFYYARKLIGNNKTGTFYFGVSDKPIKTETVGVDDWKLHRAFERFDRNYFCDDEEAPLEIRDYRYVGAFEGWVDSNDRLRSLPNKTPTGGMSLEKGRAAAIKMGRGYSTWDYYTQEMVQYLFLTEFGSPQTQNIIGHGRIRGNSNPIRSGSHMEQGNKTWGYLENEKEAMSYRGIENWYGSIYKMTDGFITTSSNRDVGIAQKGFNSKGNGDHYEKHKIGYVDSGNIRYIDDTVGFVGTESGGSYNKDGFGDYGYMGSSSFRVGRFGGYWSDGSSAGGFYFNVFDAPSVASSFRGARLVY